MKDNLRFSLAIGALGGCFFAFADIVNAVLKPANLIVSFGDFALYFAFSYLFCALFFAAALFVIGAAAHLLAKAGELDIGRKEWISIISGFCFLLFALIIIPTAATASMPRGMLGGEMTFYILSLPLFAFAGGASITFFLLGKYGEKRVFAFSLAALAVLTLFSSPVLWWVNSSKLDRAIYPRGSDYSSSKAGDRPNILWIIMDAARADRFSSYGYSRNTTPRIDALAKEGVIYENAVSVAPWTVPSHASMVTGLFPGAHGTGNWLWLEDRFETAAEILKKNGYDTILLSNNSLFGKSNNLAQGFDVFIRPDIRRVSPFGTLNYLLKFVAAFRKTVGRISGSGKADDFLVFCERYILDLIRKDHGAYATNVLFEKYLNGRNSSAPFFAMINYMEAHDPYGDTPSAGKYAGEKFGSFLAAGMKAFPVGRNWWQYLGGLKKISDSEKEAVSALYDGDVSYLDSKIGELADFLRSRGVLDNTLLIITSDHGENLGERNLFHHMLDLHGTLVHIPLIIRYPRAFPRGKRVSGIVQNLDILPTLLAAAEIKTSGGDKMQGINLLSGNYRSLAFSEVDYKNVSQKEVTNIAAKDPSIAFDRLGIGRWIRVRDADYSYIQFRDGEYLYDLRKDPLEKNDISRINRRKVSEYRAKIKKWLDSYRHYWN